MIEFKRELVLRVLGFDSTLVSYDLDCSLFEFQFFLSEKDGENHIQLLAC